MGLRDGLTVVLLIGSVGFWIGFYVRDALQPKTLRVVSEEEPPIAVGYNEKKYNEALIKQLKQFRKKKYKKPELRLVE